MVLKLTFDADGKIRQVIPTRKGIEPVVIPNIENYLTGITPSHDDHGEVLDVTYYHINGSCLGKKVPVSSGLYIRKEVLSNGKVRSMKIVK